jgi:competence protein ComEA
VSRPQAIAVVLAAAGLLGVFAARRPAPELPPLACPDGGPVRLDAEGVATCGPGRDLPAGQALTLGQKFDCNTASEADLALVPGVGPSLAHELVAARDGGFTSWAQVDAVVGVGPARLNALQAACDIRGGDAGVW